jgi:mRNA interferase HigB
MHVIGRKVLEDFGKKHAQAKRPLAAWYTLTKDAAWTSLVEVKKVYPATDYVNGWTVFNISGNKYRLISRIIYKARLVYIDSICTHAEYTKRKL